jgi:hypothetical protein
MHHENEEYPIDLVLLYSLWRDEQDRDCQYDLDKDELKQYLTHHNWQFDNNIWTAS